MSQSGADLTNLSILSQTLVNSIDQLNEFSYFKSDKLKLWMGPDRWKPLSLGAMRPKTAQVIGIGMAFLVIPVQYFPLTTYKRILIIFDIPCPILLIPMIFR